MYALLPQLIETKTLELIMECIWISKWFKMAESMQMLLLNLDVAILECIYQLAAMYIVFPLSFRPRAEFPVLSQYRYNILYTTSGFSA